jgi:NAD(P)-dependent dehydrogenase (short-subunit alcohol dehydrogenase family)
MPAPDVSHLSLHELISLRGRVAIITGGARGIGLAIARRLAEAGAEITIADLNEPLARAAAAGIANDFGVRTLACELDVTDSRSVAATADRTVAELGSLDIWVNNAGIYPVSPCVDLTDEEWDSVNDVNLRGTFLGCREAAKRMRQTAHASKGVILNIASMAGFRGRAGCAHYGATKHAVVGLTKSLAVELGPHGIRVMAVAPTLAETPGVHERRAAAAGESGEIMTALEQKVIATIPLGRSAQPDDIARAALFCVSDLATFVTGTTVFADGGHSAF